MYSPLLSAAQLDRELLSYLYQKCKGSEVHVRYVTLRSMYHASSHSKSDRLDVFSSITADVHVRVSNVD